MSQLGMRWINSAPIWILSAQEFARRAKILLENLKEWDEVKEPTGEHDTPDILPFDTNIDQKDWKTTKRTQQERWNDRIKATKNLVGSMCNQNQDEEGTYYVEYRVAGAPVGLMVLVNTPDHATIALLVSHPGAEGAGGIVIEYAVRQSEVWGNGGKLVLSANDDECQKAYDKLGFDGNSVMTLDPESASVDGKQVWCKFRDGWRLAKYAGLKYRGQRRTALGPTGADSDPASRDIGGISLARKVSRHPTHAPRRRKRPRRTDQPSTFEPPGVVKISIGRA